MQVLNANAEEQPPNISLNGFEKCNHACLHCCGGTLPTTPRLPEGFVNTLVSLSEYFQHFHKSTAANIMVVTGALADFSAQLDVWQKACQQKIELKKGMGVWIDPHHLQRLIKHAESAVSKKTPHHNLVKALLTHLLGMEKYLATNAEKMDRRLLSAIVGYVNNRYPDLTQPVERYFRCINLNRGYLLKRKLEAPTHYPIKKHRILEPVKKSSLKQISEQRSGKIDEVVKNKSKAPALISKISKPTGFNSLASMSPFHDSDSSKLTTSSTTLTTSSRSIPLPATSNWGFPVVSSMVPNGSSRSVSVVSNSTVSGSSRSVPVMPSMSMRSIPVPSSTPASGVWAVNSNSGLGVNSVSVPWVPAISTSVSNGHGQVLSDSVLNVSKSTVGSTSGGVLSKAQVIYVRRNTSSAKGGNIPSEVGQPKSFPVFSSSISSKTIVDMAHIHNISGQNNYTPRFGSVFKTNSPEFNARSISASTANTQPQNIVSPALSSRKVMSTSDSMQNRTVRPTFQSIFSSAQRISNSQSTFTTVKVPSNVSSMSQLDYLKYLPPSSSS